MSVRTPLCDLLGIDTPILNVGFAASAVPELAAAVSNAGGLGVLGLGFPIVAASAADTFYSPDLYDVGWKDAPHRTIKNKTYARWDAAGRPPSGERPGEGEIIGTQRFPWGDVHWQRYAVGMPVPTFDGDPEDAPMWAGLSIDRVNDVRPAGDIVRDLVRETEEALAD